LAVKEALEAQFTLAQAELTMVPKTTVALNDDQLEQLSQLVAKLEDDDDVSEVYTNLAE